MMDRIEFQKQLLMQANKGGFRHDGLLVQGDQKVGWMVFKDDLQINFFEDEEELTDYLLDERYKSIPFHEFLRSFSEGEVRMGVRTLYKDWTPQQVDELVQIWKEMKGMKPTKPSPFNIFWSKDNACEITISEGILLGLDIVDIVNATAHVPQDVFRPHLLAEALDEIRYVL